MPTPQWHGCPACAQSYRHTFIVTKHRNSWRDGPWGAWRWLVPHALLWSAALLLWLLLQVLQVLPKGPCRCKAEAQRALLLVLAQLCGGRRLQLFRLGCLAGTLNL